MERVPFHVLRKGFYLFTYKLSLQNQKIEWNTPEEGRKKCHFSIKVKTNQSTRRNGANVKNNKIPDFRVEKGVWPWFRRVCVNHKLSGYRWYRRNRCSCYPLTTSLRNPPCKKVSPWLYFATVLERAFCFHLVCGFQTINCNLLFRSLPETIFILN